ncbi:hypothetical protein [uncultured Dubosiella sp.]|uniref:hypothetical protein n=1 Tax=uncultured Dubosiella sp. TaxID=1937011 RepID=UPI00262C5ED4|nr:hypothetical protein [uncultured Dubosiella sp.]
MEERKKEVIAFAKKWIEEFDDWDVEDIRFSEMKEDCETLGFSLIDGSLPEIKQIDEIEELEAVIYTQCENMLNKKTIPEQDLWFWFQDALDCLSRIARGCFFGIPETIKIESSPVFFISESREGRDIYQSIEISSSGKVKIIRTVFKDETDRIKVQDLQLDDIAVQRLMDAFAQYFSHTDRNEVYATDIGTWDVEMINTKGNLYEFHGSLCLQSIKLSDTNFSDLVRETLGIDDLYVLDGNDDPIRKILIEYWHQSCGDLYTEKLTLDRERETIEHIRTDPCGNRIEQKYYLKNIVKNLLNEFCDENLLSIDEEAEPVYEEPEETRNYKITIDHKYSSQSLEGKFYQNGLPDGYEDFADLVYAILRQHKKMELFDPSKYKEMKTTPKYYEYCAVVFDGNKKSYHYLAGKETLAAGDFVLVPVGRFDQISMAQLEYVEIYREDEVPYPLSKTKRIIKKCTPQEVEYFNHLNELKETR